MKTALEVAFDTAGYNDSNIINAKFSSEEPEEFESESTCALGRDDAMSPPNTSIISWDLIANERRRLNEELPALEADLPKLKQALAQIETKFNNHLALSKRQMEEVAYMASNLGFMDTTQTQRYQELQQAQLTNRTLELKLRQEIAQVRGKLQVVIGEIEYTKVVDDLDPDELDWVRFPCSPFDYVLITSLCYAIRDRIHNRIVANQFEREVIEARLATLQSQTALEHCESIRLESNLSQADELYTQLGRIDGDTDRLRRYSMVYRLVAHITARELTKEELQYKVGFPPRSTAQIRASWIESRAKKAETRLAQSRQKSSATNTFFDIS
jgi:hypothetical protein